MNEPKRTVDPCVTMTAEDLKAMLAETARQAVAEAVKA